MDADQKTWVASSNIYGIKQMPLFLIFRGTASDMLVLRDLWMRKRGSHSQLPEALHSNGGVSM